MNEFLVSFLFSVTGSLIGILTGLIPGLHTNNVALLSLALFSMSDKMGLYFCILIVSSAITHTFLDIIPSTFIGAPEEDTALVVLPAHSLLLEGRGYEAIRISALASLMSVAFCFLFLLPFNLLLRNSYDFIRALMPYILILISVIVIVTNKNIIRAVAIFILSGIFGFTIIDLNVSFLFNSSPIFPALTGLFGIPALIYSYKEKLPQQNIDISNVKISRKDVASGVASGSLVSILPGVSSAIATTLALVVRRKKNRENAVSILSATNTSTNFFVLAVLFTILKARSGFALAINEMVSVEKWDGFIIPYPYNLFLMAVVISSIISYYSTIFIGKIIAKNISKISYSIILKISLIIIISMVFIFSGFLGLLILTTASFIGILCLQAKVKRSLCMGVLLFPLIIKYIL